MPLLSFLSKKRQSRPSGRGGQENVPSAAVARTRDNDRRSSYAAADLTKPPQPQHHRQQSQQHRRASIAATAVAAQRATPSPPAELLSDGPGAISCDAGSSGGDERQALAAPTVATGPRDHAQAQDTGTEQEERRSSRRYSVRRDPFRLFRSRSSQFRADGIAIGADVASEGHQHRARVSWPVQRRSTSSTPASEVQQGEVQTQTRTSAPSPVPVPVAAARNVREEATADERREPEGLPVDQRIGATGKAWPGRALELDAPPAAAAVAAAAQAQRQARRRSTADVSSAANSNPPASSSNALQRLRRLPSLSLKRGFSRRKKVEMPSVMVTPATVISNSSPSTSAPGSISPPSRRATQSPPANHNKPLPPTPPYDGRQGDSPYDVPKVNRLRLNRIMATLSSLDIEKLFSGAPQYFARSEGHFTGAPHPSVAFPWDEELAIRDLTDHVQIEDEAWGSITAWPHITRDIRRGPSASATSKVAEKRRAHFYPRCRERPNMLSMQGLEKGTMGYQAALELGVSDALQEEQWGFGSLGAKDDVVIEARKNLIVSKDGLRRLEETTVLDHLMKNAQRYQEKHAKDRSSCQELFHELFTQILHPPHRTFADPSNLAVQIQALVKVLAQPNVWIDFSHVEWRIRLGQILWGTPDDDGDDSVSDGASIREADDAKGLHEERYWLLLHILLACELLIRLDTITEGDEIPGNIRPAEIHRFEREANATVKWSLHLARVWLENIEITKSRGSANGGNDQPKGWLANLTQKMSLTNERPHSRHHERHHERHQDSNKQQNIYVMRGKYWERQVRGLTHFARRLKWPDIDTQSGLISDNCRAVTEGTPLYTPFETPASAFTTKSKDSSYFAISTEKSGTRKQPRRQKVGAALHPAGWLSKSYVSGLMLPGEGLYHFIMSTLLETDVESMAKLGPMANLCGGFIYNDKSFWSTACVVGRVLAAGHGAVECMGWISSDVVPQDLNDGWVNIEVEDVAEDVGKSGKKARIWGKLAIERESSVLGGSDPDSVLPADFIIPYENHYKTPPPTISVGLVSLDLTTPMDSVQTTPTLEVVSPYSDASAVPQIKTFVPSIKFNVTTWEDDEDREYTFNMAKDVYFVTAHPCVPSNHVRILKSPSSPTIQQIDISGQAAPGGGRTSGPTKIACHPLHKYYTYTSMHLSELLAKSSWDLEQLLSRSSTHTSPTIAPSSNSARPQRVLVIDAMTNFVPQPEAHDVPLSPVTSRASTTLSETSMSSSRHSSLSSAVGGAAVDADGAFVRLRRTGTDTDKNGGAAEQQMHSETRRRQFGSDMEILVRAICAERGWNALISRRRRGCLACAIREAGALGWRVVIRVD